MSNRVLHWTIGTIVSLFWFFSVIDINIVTLGANVDKYYTWLNWQRDMSCKATGTFCPEDEYELVEWVKEHHEKKSMIKPVGRGHVFGNITTCVSYTDTARESWILKLDNFHNLSVDTSNPNLMTATFGAGWTLNDLVLELAEYNYGNGLTVKNTGTERVQNFVGAFTTGTHGTGIDLQNMAAPVLSLKLLMANGTFLYIDENSPYYNARLTIGAIGIITEVTIEIVEIEYFKRTDINISSSNITDFWATVISEYALVYDRFQVKDLEFTWDRVNNKWEPAKSARITYWEKTNITDVNNCSIIALCCGDCYPSVCYDKDYSAIAAPIQGHECGPLFEAEFEHIFPVDFDTSEGIIKFYDLVESYQQFFDDMNMTSVIETFEPFDGTLSDIKLRNPELRFVKADDMWMSEANNYSYEQVGTDLFAIWNVDLKMPFSNWETLYFYQDVLAQFVPALGEAFNIRPHWGKFSNFDYNYTKIVYPMVDQFLALRDQTDPYCQFQNEFLMRHLGLEEQCADVFDLSATIDSNDDGNDEMTTTEQSTPMESVFESDTMTTMECCMCNNAQRINILTLTSFFAFIFGVIVLN